jgi:hypothetical protein
MKTTTKIILCAAIAVLSVPVMLTGCDIVTGSGQTDTLELAHTDFTRVEISTGFDMEITRSDDFQVSITIDKSLYEYLTIAQRGDTLLIGLKSNRTYTAAARSGVIYMPDLRRLELSGGSKAKVTGFSVDHAVDIELSGESYLDLEPMQSGDTDIVVSGGSTFTGEIQMTDGSFEVSGGSKLTLKGQATGIKVNASGTSEVTLDEFPVTTVYADLSGGSRAVIKVSDTLDVHLSGESILDYIGDPKISGMDISGGSILNKQ